MHALLATCCECFVSAYSTQHSESYLRLAKLFSLFFFIFIVARVISRQTLHTVPVHQAHLICIQPFLRQARLKSDSKQHMRREDFDTADQRQPHLCSPRQICLLISFHPAEGLRWLTSVAAHPGQSTTHRGDLKDNFVL